MLHVHRGPMFLTEVGWHDEIKHLRQSNTALASTATHLLCACRNLLKFARQVFQLCLASDGDGSEKNRRALDTYGTLLNRRGLQSIGAIPCVSPECENWMVPAGMWDDERIKCHVCHTEFCGRYCKPCELFVGSGSP